MSVGYIWIGREKGIHYSNTPITNGYLDDGAAHVLPRFVHKLRPDHSTALVLTMLYRIAEKFDEDVIEGLPRILGRRAFNQQARDIRGYGLDFFKPPNSLQTDGSMALHCLEWSTAPDHRTKSYGPCEVGLCVTPPTHLNFASANSGGVGKRRESNERPDVD